MALPSHIVKELSEIMRLLDHDDISTATFDAIEKRLDEIERLYPAPTEERSTATFQSRLGAFRQRGF